MKFMIAVFLFLFSFVSCSPTIYTLHNEDRSFKLSSRSVVSVIERVEITDDVGLTIGTGVAEVCNAFCVQDDYSPKKLVTSMHCVENPALGTTFMYISPDGVGAKTATVEWFGQAGDRIVASVNDDALVPLKIDTNFYPSDGDDVYSYSSIHNQLSVGTVIGELSHFWFDTNQTTDYGWSGSPAISENGYAWGIIHGAFKNNETNKVIPGYTIVSTIY